MTYEFSNKKTWKNIESNRIKLYHNAEKLMQVSTNQLGFDIFDFKFWMRSFTIYITKDYLDLGVPVDEMDFELQPPGAGLEINKFNFKLGIEIGDDLRFLIL